MTARSLAAAAVMIPLAWPQPAATCDLTRIAGRWIVQVIETETVYPEEGGYTEETSHIVCNLRITRRGTTTATCSAGPYSSSAGEGRERYTLTHYIGQSRCEWTLASVLDPFGEPVNGTGDGSNRLMFDRDATQFLGNGNLPLGIGGDRLPERSGDNFRTTLIGMKR